LPFH